MKSCKILTQKYKKRRKRLEWEHIVPTQSFGQSFKEWREAKNLCKRKGKKSLSGRKCTFKLSKEYRKMEADIHNLVPVVGAINGLRSKNSFTNIEDKKFELCRDGMRQKGNKNSPPDNKKGDVARIYFYMDKSYPNRGILGKNREKLE